DRRRPGLGSARAAEGGRGELDPGRAAGEARAVTRVEIADAIPRAAEIVADVRERGDAALLDWTERLDGERPSALRVPADEIAAAEAEPAFLAAVRRLAEAFRAVHELHRPPDTTASPLAGVRVERRFVPDRKSTRLNSSH